MKIAVLIILLLLGSAGATQGATLTVAPAGTPYPNIQDAVDHAVAGDTILIQKGHYTGQVVVSSSLILRGAGTGESTLSTGSSGTALSILAAGVQVEGLTIAGVGVSTGIHVAADSVELRNLEVIGFGAGVILEGSSGCRITDSKIVGSSGYGLTLNGMTGSTVTHNALRGNSGAGLYIDGRSSGNTIYLNNFNNGQNVVVEDSENSWNSPAPISYSFNGLIRQGMMGNFWSDYDGADTDGNGIGDSPYLFESKKGKSALKNPQQKTGDADRYPLMGEWEGLFLAINPTTVTILPTTNPVAVTETSAQTTNTTSIPVRDSLLPPAGGGLPFLPAFLFLAILGFAGSAFYLMNRRDPLKAHPSSASTDTIIQQESFPPLASEISEGGSHFPPELRDRYTRIEYAGKGGIARVFKAVRKSDGHTVAVKIPVSFDEATGRAFMKEMRVWEDLRHPNIVEVAAVNILPIPFVEMDYFDRSLDQCKKPLELSVAVKIVRGIAAGLLYAHQSGVIHRDLKPHNILLAKDLTPKIADWGLSHVLSRETAASMVGFSLPYASPEQISPHQFGPTGPWTDIYQLGVILYELVTGTLPFGGEGFYETGTAILTNTPVSPTELRPEAASILPVIMRCLEKEPSQRYQSVEEFLKDLGHHFPKGTYFYR